MSEQQIATGTTVHTLRKRQQRQQSRVTEQQEQPAAWQEQQQLQHSSSQFPEPDLEAHIPQLFQHNSMPSDTSHRSLSKLVTLKRCVHTCGTRNCLARDGTPKIFRDTHDAKRHNACFHYSSCTPECNGWSMLAFRPFYSEASEYNVVRSAQLGLAPVLAYPHNLNLTILPPVVATWSFPSLSQPFPMGTVAAPGPVVVGEQYDVPIEATPQPISNPGHGGHPSAPLHSPRSHHGTNHTASGEEGAALLTNQYPDVPQESAVGLLALANPYSLCADDSAEAAAATLCEARRSQDAAGAGPLRSMHEVANHPPFPPSSYGLAWSPSLPDAAQWEMEPPASSSGHPPSPSVAVGVSSSVNQETLRRTVEEYCALLGPSTARNRRQELEFLVEIMHLLRDQHLGLETKVKVDQLFKAMRKEDRDLITRAGMSHENLCPRRRRHSETRESAESTPDSPAVSIGYAGAREASLVRFIEHLMNLEDDLRLGPDSSFLDIGSGVGQCVLFVELVVKSRECVGIEYVGSRLQVAEDIRNELQTIDADAVPMRSRFVHGNIADKQHWPLIQAATHIWMLDLVFHPQTHRTILPLICAEKPRIVVSCLTNAELRERWPFSSSIDVSNHFTELHRGIMHTDGGQGILTRIFRTVPVPLAETALSGSGVPRVITGQRAGKKGRGQTARRLSRQATKPQKVGNPSR
jgi:hypothetical protein